MLCWLCLTLVGTLEAARNAEPPHSRLTAGRS